MNDYHFEGLFIIISTSARFKPASQFQSLVLLIFDFREWKNGAKF